MPWCPICKNEYREGITVCADCKADLVDQLAEDFKEQNKFLADFELEEAAKKFVSYLEYSKIAAYYEQKEGTKDAPVYSVFVQKKDYKQAKKALGAFYTVELSNQYQKMIEAARNNKETSAQSDSSADDVLTRTNAAFLQENAPDETFENFDLENPDLKNLNPKDFDLESQNLESFSSENFDSGNPNSRNLNSKDFDLESQDLESFSPENFDSENPDLRNLNSKNFDLESQDLESFSPENFDSENPDLRNLNSKNLDLTNPDSKTDSKNLNSENLEELKELEELEESSSNGTAYVTKAEKSADYQSSAITFTVFGIVGLAAMVLHWIGILFQSFSTISAIVMTVMFAAFIVIGIDCFSRAKKAKAEAVEEERFVRELTKWLEGSLTFEMLSAADQEENSKEVNFLNRIVEIKRMITKQFGALDPAFLDQFVEDYYNSHFE